MPRRPRPASRRPPSDALHKDAAASQFKITPARALPQKPSDSEDDADSDGEDTEDMVEVRSGENAYSSEEEDAVDVDVDAPRVAQWVDDEDIQDSVDESEGSEEEQESGLFGPGNLKRLQEDLSSLPLGTLRKAQSALARAKSLRDQGGGESDSSDEDGYESPPEEEPSRTDGKAKDKEQREKRDIQKRANKHAPMEMTSKRPVPRKKANIEEKKLVPRDPRFLHVAGEFDPGHFRTQYGFLSNLHEEELKTLKDSLKRARKMLLTSPKDLRQEREQEVQRLERAVKRAESLVNRDKREKIEQSALTKVRKEEKEKRQQGKKAWHMKDTEKKEMLTRAKFEALAESGGRGAVRKAIEKKQKKVDQKEKKKRPFVPGENSKRPNRFAQDGTRPNKRQRSS